MDVKGGLKKFLSLLTKPPRRTYIENEVKYDWLGCFEQSY
jgi:hypothetical protein